jgi:eukaryotic-like serine/threonine-protein kinase
VQTLNLIARGGFGRVERVQLDDGTVAARKTFMPPIGMSQENVAKFRKRFGREVRTQGAMTSQSFLPVLAHDLDSDEPWFVMPLADRSLQDEISMLRTSGEVPAKALADLLNGLEELHSLGMVHRDLKPQNVLLHNGVWKLADFGLVLPLSSDTTQLTSTDSAWGTTNYASPEQAIGFHNVGPEADIYAFGCVLHDIFGSDARVPFARQSAPGPIGAIIEKCTEQDAKRRFKSVHAVRGALLTSLAGTPTTTIGGPAADWAARLPACESWTSEQVTDFVRAIKRMTSWADRYAVFSVLDEAAIESLYIKNSDSWKVLAIEFCEWAEGSFEWSFCDVVIGRLQSVFTLGDLEVKACAAVAAAHLGAAHNRWFVMRRLLSLAGPTIDDTVAARLAIEIQAREVQPNFRRCAEAVQNDPNNVYHPSIAAILQRPPAANNGTS